MPETIWRLFTFEQSDISSTHFARQQGCILHTLEECEKQRSICCPAKESREKTRQWGLQWESHLT